MLIPIKNFEYGTEAFPSKLLELLSNLLRANPPIVKPLLYRY